MLRAEEVRAAMSVTLREPARAVDGAAWRLARSWSSVQSSRKNWVCESWITSADGISYDGRCVTYDVVAPVSHGFLEIVCAAVHPAQTIQAGNTVETGLFFAADVVHR